MREGGEYLHPKQVLDTHVSPPNWLEAATTFEASKMLCPHLLLLRQEKC